MMRGLMQDQPLLISTLIEHAAAAHPQREIVFQTWGGRRRGSGRKESC